MNNLAVLPYFLIRFLIRDSVALEKAFRILLGVGLAESVYGILCYLSHQIFATTVGMEIGQYLGNVAAPYGSLYEPNLFGAYAACCAVLFLAMYLSEREHRHGYLICLVVASMATVLSFSRAALLALVIVAAFVFWRMRQRWRNTGQSKRGTLLPALTLILIIAVGAMSGGLQERMRNLFEQGIAEESTATRILSIWESLQDVPDHLLLGSGTASLQLSFDWSKYVPSWTEGTWVGNVGVRILHDTGLIGLTVFLGFLVSLTWKIRHAFRSRNSQIPMLVALSAGAFLYGISFQLTDGTTLAFSWVHLGLLASAAALLGGTAQNRVTE